MTESNYPPLSLYCQKDMMYEYLGTHRIGDHYVFRVFAPKADIVYLCGDFNFWQESLPMKRLEYSDVWEAYVDAHKIVDNTKYKYKLICDGCSFMETDPFANRCEPSPETASLICDLDSYKWRDKGWLFFIKSL